MKFLTLFIVISILFLALSPENLGFTLVDFKNSDKLKHVFAFFVLSYFLYKTFYRLTRNQKFLLLVFFAFLIEFLQIFSNRESSLMDFLASVFGICLYLVVDKVLKRRDSFDKMDSYNLK